MPTRRSAQAGHRTWLHGRHRRQLGASPRSDRLVRRRARGTRSPKRSASPAEGLGDVSQSSSGLSDDTVWPVWRSVIHVPVQPVTCRVDRHVVDPEPPVRRRRRHRHPRPRHTRSTAPSDPRPAASGPECAPIARCWPTETDRLDVSPARCQIRCRPSDPNVDRTQILQQPSAPSDDVQEDRQDDRAAGGLGASGRRPVLLETRLGPGDGRRGSRWGPGWVPPTRSGSGTSRLAMPWRPRPPMVQAQAGRRSAAAEGRSPPPTPRRRAGGLQPRAT